MGISAEKVKNALGSYTADTTTHPTYKLASSTYTTYTMSCHISVAVCLSCRLIEYSAKFSYHMLIS